MEKDYIPTNTQCLWYEDCCGEKKCNGRGDVRIKTRKGLRNLVIISSPCKSFWPANNEDYAINEQLLKESQEVI